MKNILRNRFYQIFSLFTILIFLGVGFRGDDDIYDRINRNLDVFGKVFKEVALNYVDDIDVDRFMKEGIDGMLKTLDPYTVYYGDQGKNEIDLIVNGKYGGIGITISYRDSAIFISNVMNGYEAQKKGLRIGDRILSVEGVDLKDAKTDLVNKLVKGAAGTSLKMTIQRDEQILDFDLTRQEIILKNISYSGFIGDDNDGIAYFKLDRFTSTAVDEVETTLKTFKLKNNFKGLVIDLRDNGGGLLDAAIGILNKLVSKNNLLVITKGKKKDSEIKYFSKEDPLIPKEIPVVLLVNKGTASASEIMAGAIQDLDRGVIIGSQTYGKGLVQIVKDIDSDAKLKITTSRYYTPSGRWIQEKNYFRENKFGVFIDKETFSQNEFRTLGGRIVYANGGITPDIIIKTEPESEIHSALLYKDMFFKFGNYYLDRNPGIKIFNCTDAIFEEFKNYISTNGFIYKSEAYKKIEDLKKIADLKGYSNGFSQDLEKLSGELNKENSAEIEKSREELKRAIEAEINRRIVNEKEQIEALFPSDIQLQEALRIIRNTEEYRKLLSSN
jgi:carboxyl-terminal processing protease